MIQWLNIHYIIQAKVVFKRLSGCVKHILTFDLWCVHRFHHNDGTDSIFTELQGLKPNGSKPCFLLWALQIFYIFSTFVPKAFGNRPFFENRYAEKITSYHMFWYLLSIYLFQQDEHLLVQWILGVVHNHHYCFYARTTSNPVQCAHQLQKRKRQLRQLTFFLLRRDCSHAIISV